MEPCRFCPCYITTNIEQENWQCSCLTNNYDGIMGVPIYNWSDACVHLLIIVRFLSRGVSMGYGDGRAKGTGRIGEAEARNALIAAGFQAEKPPGKDIGVDLEIWIDGKNSKKATAQVKGRRHEAEPLWFAATVTSRQLQNAWETTGSLRETWKERILSVDFWLLVSVPRNEIWVLPASKAIELAIINEPFYQNRRDNQYDRPFIKANGKIESKQKELNLGLTVEEQPLTQKFGAYLNNFVSIREFLTDTNS